LLQGGGFLAILKQTQPKSKRLKLRQAMKAPATSWRGLFIWAAVASKREHNQLAFATHSAPSINIRDAERAP
jgi:hypothetical protein